MSAKSAVQKILKYILDRNNESDTAIMQRELVRSMDKQQQKH